MNWFAEELQKQRVSKGLSLNEIALMTRINVHFLEELEQGNFEALPQTYVRAFIREYAAGVGLNPRETLERYDLYLGKKLEPAPEPTAAEQTDDLQKKPWFSGTRVPVIIISSVVVLCALGIYLFSHPPKSRSVPQIAFDEVVRESESLAAPKRPAEKHAVGVPVTPALDSLRLSSHTTDTVWASVIIDGKRTEEYLFPPNSNYSWTAKEKFQVTLGNAGHIQFTLNGTALAPFGRPRAVVRNVLVTKELLRNPGSEHR